MQQKPQSPAKGKASAAMTALREIVQILSENKDGGPLPKQNPLLQNLLLTISRHRASFDFLLDTNSTGKIRARLRRVLWWACAELFFLEGLPPHVVADVATDFVKKRYSAGEAGFVNALLRKLALSAQGGSYLPEGLEIPPFVRFELPEELYRHWKNIWGDETLAEWCALWQSPPEIILRRRRNATGAIPADLERMDSPEWAGNQQLFRMKNSCGTALREILQNGKEFYAQDPSTLLAPEMLKVQPGETVADLCCAPGGKSLLLAEALQNQGILYCRDRSEGRLGRVRENLSGFSNVNIAPGDALHSDLSPGSLDALLLDVPCSNAGVIRRRPDVRWTWTAQKLQELITLQAEILESTCQLVKPGGRLVYSTCSIEPEENSAQAQKFLQHHPEFSLLREQQLFPDQSHDGAYATLFLRG